MKRVLIYEGMPGHGECLSSYYAYFTTLGYEVSFVMRDVVAREHPLWMVDKNIPTYVITASLNTKNEHFNEIHQKVPDITQYDLHFIGTFATSSFQYVKFLISLGIPKNKILHQNHLNYDQYLLESRYDTLFGRNGFLLGTVDNEYLPQLAPSKNISELSHKPIKKVSTQKKSIKLFISGLSNNHFKNFEIFVQALNEINAENKHITATVTGTTIQKELSLPESEYITYYNRLDFKDMAEHYTNDDFLFVLFDEKPLWAQEAANTFLRGRVSGSRNMSIMYKIPLVVQKPFQKIWGFDDTNSIGYEGHDYKQVLSDLYELKTQTYNKIIKALYIKEDQEFQLGLNNLQNKIESLPTFEYEKPINKKREKFIF